MMARNANVPFKGRIQKRKTYHLQIITFGLQRAAGPYSWVNRALPLKPPTFAICATGRSNHDDRRASRAISGDWPLSIRRAGDLSLSCEPPLIRSSSRILSSDARAVVSDSIDRAVEVI
jgi:hypothetical protein